MSTFAIKTEKFEGPIELLLDLIEKRKMHISEVSLASVADDFINYVQTQPEMPLADTAQFLVVASTLVLIKSLSLLPTLSVTEEERSSIEDLERRVRLYQLIRERATDIQSQYGKDISFERQGTNRPIVFAPGKDITLAGIATAIKNVYQNLPVHEVLPQVMVRKVRSLEEVMGDLAERITKSLRIGFNEFSGKGKAAKIEVAVSFLAMLELVKQGSLEVLQQARFADIHMESRNYGVPRYD